MGRRREPWDAHWHASRSSPPVSTSTQSVGTIASAKVYLRASAFSASRVMHCRRRDRGSAGRLRLLGGRYRGTRAHVGAGWEELGSAVRQPGQGDWRQPTPPPEAASACLRFLVDDVDEDGVEGHQNVACGHAPIAAPLRGSGAGGKGFMREGGGLRA